MQRPLRILIVEDDPAQSAAIEARLHERVLSALQIRIEIVVARTLAAALGMAAAANVTILDLGLPDSAPADTAAAIPRFRPPVIVLTGHEDTALVALCYHNLARHVFVKGITSGLCQQVIDCLISDLRRQLDPADAAADPS